MWQEFKLAYYEAIVQHFSDNTRESPPTPEVLRDGKKERKKERVKDDRKWRK